MIKKFAVVRTTASHIGYTISASYDNKSEALTRARILMAIFPDEEIFIFEKIVGVALVMKPVTVETSY